MSLNTKVISVTSGKGGVGKTSILSNMAIQMAKQGKRVLILDGDLGMANVDIMFNVRAERHILDVVTGKASLQDILLHPQENIAIIPGGSGVFALQNLSVFEKQALLNEVSTLGHDYDVMLIDTAPGIDDNVLYLNSAAQEICVVVTPEPASVADAYALIKVLNQRCRETKFSIVCNQVRDDQDGQRLFAKLDQVASQFLYVSLDYKGSIPNDPNLRQSTRAQQLVSRAHPDSPSVHAFRSLASNLLGNSAQTEMKGGLQFFWEQLVGVA